MMRTMRASAKWIMGVVAVTFVGWMVFSVGMDISGSGGGVTATDAVARVNGVKIELQTYDAAVRNAQEQQRQRVGTAPVTLEDRRALEDAVLENLIQEILLEQEYARRNIHVTDQEIIQAARTSPPADVMQLPNFQTDGQFDLVKYQRYLATNTDPGFTMALEARYRQEIPRLKLFEQLTADIYIPDSELWQSFRDAHDSITLGVIEILPDAAIPDSQVTVTDDEVRLYYDDHADDFTRPAVAYTSYVKISRVPNQADTAAAFSRAEAIRQEIVGGAAFADVASRESADSASRRNGGDLGMVDRDRFVPEFTEAALALRRGQISQPVQTPFGIHIIQLEAKPRDSIHARHVLIPIELSGDHLDEVDAKADTLDIYGAAQSDPTALDEVAAMLNRPIAQAAPVTKDNRLVADGSVVPDAGMWAFEARVGETSEVIEARDAFYLFRLDSLRAEGIPPFDDIESAVRRAALSAKKWDAARTMAEEIAVRLRSGQALMEAALSNVLSANTFGPMTRVAPTSALRSVPEVVGAGFGLGVGEASGPIETETAIYFVEPTAKHLADSSAFLEQIDAQRAQTFQRARQLRVQQVLMSLRNSADVIDRRRELDRTLRELEDAADQNPFNPLGF